MGDIAQPKPQITVTPATEFDLKEALMGSGGNPSYENQFGLTSAPLGGTGIVQPSLAELELAAQQALARATDPLAFASQGQPGQLAQAEDFNTELDKYKKLYGESENEKGQLRKNQQELMEAFNGLMAQYEELKASPQPQQWSPAMAPNQFGQMPYGQPQFQDPFEGVPDGEYLDGKTVKNIVERAIGQSTAFMAGQVQQAQNRAAQIERQLLVQSRANMGLSKLDEYRIASKNPWLNGLPETQRLAAIQSLKLAEGTGQTQPNGHIGQPPQATTESQNRILNRVTYIEGTNPSVPDLTEAALEAAKQRDYAIVMNAAPDTGERAKLFRQFANKYGLQIGQNPSDLAR